MKNIILSVSAILIGFALSAQTPKYIFKVVSIMQSQSFYLNGGARSAFGGHSREPLQIDLPPNTVEWYYVVTTSPNKQQSPNMGLSSQLLKMLVPGMGIGTSLLSSLMIPPGTGACDFWLMTNQLDVDNFMLKQPLHYEMNDSRLNLSHGVVQVKDRCTGTVWLGLRNPSISAGTNVTIEISAIVRESSNLGNAKK